MSANKVRNRIAIIAITLTTLLFTSIFTMGSGLVQNMQRGMLRQAGGDGHAVLKYINDAQYEKVKDHPLIKEIAYCMALCDEVENKAFLKRRAELWYYDEVGLRLGFISDIKGHLPEKSNEIMADTVSLQLLGVPLEEGATVELELRIRDQNVKRRFVLAGWWESDPIFNVGQFFTSKAYVAGHQEELRNTYYEDYSMAGAISAYIMFHNTWDMQGKLSKVMSDSQFSLDEKDDNYVSCNLNWAYLSANISQNPETVIAVGFGCLLVLLVGYLIINNIFLISVVKDTRFYGLLKAVGTTPKQLRRIISKQAIFLALIGIPIGIILGILCGKALIPIILKNTIYGTAKSQTLIKPIMIIGPSVFSLLTVWLSTFKPGRMAGRISPVEAIKYAGADKALMRKKQKKGKKGAKMSRMALSNLGRHKKQTVLVVLSLSLSLMLLESVMILANSIDVNAYCSKMSSNDFLVAHADYFNNDFGHTTNDMSIATVEKLQRLDGFERGGGVYGGSIVDFSIIDPLDKHDTDYNRDREADPYMQLFGLDAMQLEQCVRIDGEIDEKKLETGKYILEGIPTDDYENPYMDRKHFEIGDKITIKKWGVVDEAREKVATYEVTVIGHVAIKYYTMTDRCWHDYVLYTSSEGYKQFVDEPKLMNYGFDVADEKKQAAEAFLKQYTEEIEPEMNYSSRTLLEKDCLVLKQTVLMIGGGLGVIIGIIGIVNLLNTLITTILSRLQEFAMLESIGMTKRQLRRMLAAEGLYYAGFAVVFAWTFGSIFYGSVIRKICENLWFTSFQFNLFPLIVMTPIFIAIGFYLPQIIFSKAVCKASIVERIRSFES